MAGSLHLIISSFSVAPPSSSFATKFWRSHGDLKDDKIFIFHLGWRVMEDNSLEGRTMPPKSSSSIHGRWLSEGTFSTLSKYSSSIWDHVWWKTWKMAARDRFGLCQSTSSILMEDGLARERFRPCQNTHLPSVITCDGRQFFRRKNYVTKVIFHHSWKMA